LASFFLKASLRTCLWVEVAASLKINDRMDRMMEIPA
jgi:hypothetical protein